MNEFRLHHIYRTRIQLFEKLKLFLVVASLLLFPNPASADIVYGTVTGVSQDNLTLVVYKGDETVSSVALRSTGNNQYEYQLNLTPGSYDLQYNEVKKPIVNYPGTNRVNVNY